MSLLKNVQVYHAPAMPGEAELAAMLESKPYVPLGNHDMARSSFVENRKTGDLVTPIAGGYAIVYRHDKKVLPPAAVNQAIEERILEIMENENRSVGRKEKAEIKDQVLMSMLPSAFVTSSLTHVFYDRAHSLLLVATGSPKSADDVTTFMREAMGSLKVLPVRVDNLDARLTNALNRLMADDDADSFGEHTFANYVQLKNQDNSKSTFDIRDGIDPAQGILEAIGNGGRVERIGLSTNDETFFRLDRDFGIKNFTTFSEDDGEDHEDQGSVWRHEASAQMAVVVGTILSLFRLFDHKPDL